MYLLLDATQTEESLYLKGSPKSISNISLSSGKTGLISVPISLPFPPQQLQISSYILNVKNKDSKVLLWLLGVVIYCALAILRQIPTLGEIITFIAGLYGFNLIIKTLFPKKKKESQIVKE